MANVNNVSNSYSSSIYGSRNVLSGLASGLDTEAMIENSVSGYKTKITQLQQQMESLTWKQDAYRSITDKMIALLDKFTSYTSKTNLTSSSYFNQAVRNVISGTFASKISATGKTSSDVQIMSAKMATAAKYTLEGGKVAGGDMNIGEAAIDWNKTFSSINGSTMTIQAGEKSYELSFDENAQYDLKGMVADINEQLKAQGAGITAEEADGTIKFTSTSEDGTEQDVSVTGVTGALAKLGKTDEDGNFAINDSESFSTKQTMAQYLSGKSINVTYNGTTKTISLKDLNLGKDLEDIEKGSDYYNQALADTIQAGLDKEFGKGQMKVTADGGKLSFETLKEGSTLKVTSDVGDALGIGSGVSNYLNTDKTLGELLGKDKDYDFSKGFTVNGVTIDGIDENTTLSTVLSKINSSGAGVTASFSSLTNKLVFTANETGKDQTIEFGGMAADLFGGGKAVEGEDAEVTALINGEEVTMQRSSNTIEIDGLKVTLKGNFDTVTDAQQEPVTIKTTTDSDNIVNDIKSFVEQYNALLKEIHDAYSTQPLYDSSGKKYSALTEDDKSSMSDSAIEKYETKAKTGLLFGDSDLSTLYSKMQGLFNSTMSEFGITATYSSSDGLTQISLDEDKLRDALEKDPDKIRNAFTSSKALGDSSDGLMTKVKNLFNTYASKSIGSPGILVNKAGTKLSSYSLTHNEVQRQIDQLQDKIDSWQTKLNKKIDYYTRQFTTLEKLMNTMNNQSSALSGLMGGY